jgi:hypothetical protein
VATSWRALTPRLPGATSRIAANSCAGEVEAAGVEGERGRGGGAAARPRGSGARGAARSHRGVAGRADRGRGGRPAGCGHLRRGCGLRAGRSGRARRGQAPVPKEQGRGGQREGRRAWRTRGETAGAAAGTRTRVCWRAVRVAGSIADRCWCSGCVVGRNGGDDRGSEHLRGGRRIRGGELDGGRSTAVDPTEGELVPLALPMLWTAGGRGRRTRWRRIGRPTVSLSAGRLVGRDRRASRSALRAATTRCSRQPARAAVVPGARIVGSLYHFDLIAAEPATAHVALQVGDVADLGAGDRHPGPGQRVRHRCAGRSSRPPSGTPVYFHLHNHGQNTWTLGSLEVEVFAEN